MKLFNASYLKPHLREDNIWNLDLEFDLESVTAICKVCPDSTTLKITRFSNGVWWYHCY